MGKDFVYRARAVKVSTAGPMEIYISISHCTRILYLDLPVTPWEAVLGAAVEVPTLAGPVRLKVPPGTHAGQKLRLPKRGLPKPHDGEGDLFAIIQIIVPTVLSERERAIFKELADISTFNPRGHFEQETGHEN